MHDSGFNSLAGACSDLAAACTSGGKQSHTEESVSTAPATVQARRPAPHFARPPHRSFSPPRRVTISRAHSRACRARTRQPIVALVCHSGQCAAHSRAEQMHDLSWCATPRSRGARSLERLEAALGVLLFTVQGKLCAKLTAPPHLLSPHSPDSRLLARKILPATLEARRPLSVLTPMPIAAPYTAKVVHNWPTPKQPVPSCRIHSPRALVNKDALQ